MSIVIVLPDNYRHDHFDLVITRKLEPGELDEEDTEVLDNLLKESKRIARRLARLDAQTDSQPIK